MSGVVIRPVSNKAEMRVFVDLPWGLHQEDPNWVPPIKPDLRRLLDPGKHPFWRSAERELFIAWRGSAGVGRIAAIIDHAYNQYRKEEMGVWGFFECVNDPEVAMALFRTAEGWLRESGAAFLRGPLNPSIHYESGLLIQGFDSPPTLMMPYNPPWYPALVRLCGFTKEKDLFAFLLDREYEFPPWVLTMARETLEKRRITIRKADPRHLMEDMDLMTRVYNECWANNWGFAPMSGAEVEESAKRIVHILDRDLAFFLVHGNEIAGICLILPDVNPLLKRFNGRLGISALIKKTLYGSEVRGLRCLLFGVREPYHRLGLPFVALAHVVQELEKKRQYQYIELGWTLEDHDEINLAFLEGGVRPRKIYRIYRKDL